MIVKSVAAETKEKKEETKAEEGGATPAAKPKPKAAAKAPAKPLPELMNDEVIPSLKATLEPQQDIIDLELSFNDNKVI